MADINGVHVILDRARAHFEGKGRKRIEIVEWPDDAGAPTVLFAKPMSLHEKNRIYKGAKKDDLAILVDAIILKAEDEAGEKLFTLEHKQPLLRAVDADVIARVGSEIIGSDDDCPSSYNLEQSTA